jgi:hypothetical protein
MVMTFFFVVLNASQVWGGRFQDARYLVLYCSNVYGIAITYVEIALGFFRAGFV